MRRRKIKKNKPMFKRKRSAARTAVNVILVIILLSGIAFLGYSVGKPIMEFMHGREDRQTNVQNDLPDVTEPTTAPTTASEETDAPPATTDPEPPAAELGNRILFVTVPADGSFDDYLDQRIIYAAENGYYGIAIELLADGGRILYNTANERAVNASAVSENAILDLSEAAQRISDAGLLPYARISMLTDHILCRLDKSVCYLFENSTSSWYDNNAANGGKPWMSAFSESAREYISDIVIEISDAGFAGIIAGEIIFPPFRNSDLNYIGAIVKAADRYTALTGFSNAVQDALGSAKSYAVEINAQDILTSKAEVLSDPSALNCNTIYVRYDSEAVGQRIVKSDASEVSDAGLSESDKVTVVFRSVADSLSGSGKTIIPAVSDEALIPTLVSLGYDEQMILVY